MEKHRKERAFYDMSGEDNIYKYITTEGKVFGEQAQKFTMLEYLQKSTGVFNDKGMLSKTEVKEMKKRAQAGEKNIWHGFISFDEEHSYQIDHPEKCIELVKQMFGEFFHDAGFDKDNMDLMCALHLDKPNHLHIHYVFWERAPKVKNQRAAGYKYRAKGKIAMSAIDKMTERLNNYVLPDNVAEIGREAVRKLRDDVEYNNARVRDIVKKQLRILAEQMPKKTMYYAQKETEPYRYLIDAVVENIALVDPKLDKQMQKFYNALQTKKEQLQGVMSNYYKKRLQQDKEMMNNEPVVQDSLPHIYTVEKLEWDFKRKMGNEVLRAVRYLQNNTYHYNTQVKHKTNDKRIKRSLAISSRKTGRYLADFLGSLADILGQQANVYSHRLDEIDAEETAQKAQETEELETRQNTKGKYNWGK